mgnify:CR=1 FL=1
MVESTVYSEPTVRAKIAIRKKIIRKREALGNAKRDEKSLTIAQHLFELEEFKKSKAILCFLSLYHEVQTDVMIWGSFRLGKKVHVPLVNSKQGNLQVARIPSLDTKNTKFVVGDYGVREPAPDVREIVSPSCIDFVIAPGLAFDVYGNRIGYGGGYYDKLLKELSRDVTQIGIGYDFQVRNLVPHSYLDRSVQFVITETKTLRCQSI